jgi:hypothetical protein
MRWFRANRIFGGVLALAALTFQLVLSFDHIHAEDIYGAAPLGASSASPTMRVVTGTTAGPAYQPSRHGDDYCPICAATSLLNNSVAPAAPQLPLPQISHAVEHVDRVAAVVIPARRAPFQSRARPSA